MKIVFLAVLIFFAIVGISHMIFEIFYHFFKIQDDDLFVVIFPKKDKEIDLEFKIRSAIAKTNKLSKNGKGNIFVITDNLDEMQKKELSLLEKDYPYLRILTKEELKEKAGI